MTTQEMQGDWSDKFCVAISIEMLLIYMKYGIANFSIVANDIYIAVL